MLTIENLLSPEMVEDIAGTLAHADFREGSRTTSNTDPELKNNLQLAPNDDRHRVGQQVLQAVQQNTDFRWTAFPAKFSFPMFSKYDPGMYYDYHTDVGLMNAGHPTSVLTDLSCTIFLSEPDSY